MVHKIEDDKKSMTEKELEEWKKKAWGKIF